MKTLNVKIAVLVLLFVSGFKQNVCSQTDTTFVLLPDSSNFVYASLLVTTPGEEAYSALGHCAIRMECPMHKLDYCFSFEMGTDSPWFNYLSFFSGQTPAGFRAIETADYVNNYKEEGRGIQQYELNLTTHQKQELWRYLDEDMVAGQHRKFDFIRNNCASMAMIAIQMKMWKEPIVVKKWPEQHRMINGDGICYLTRNAPWLQFALMTIVGTEADVFWDEEHRISPELIIEALSNAVIQSEDGSERPALTGNHKVLSEQTLFPKPAPVTPIWAFTILLALVCIMTALEWWLKWRMPAKVLDILLLLFQTMAGLLLLYMTVVTCMFGLHWNWCLLMLNPLPFLLWLFFRKRNGFRKVYAFYAVILLLFICVTPIITTQIITAHRLLAASFLVRCLSRYGFRS
jgi:hypothetical protein